MEIEIKWDNIDATRQFNQELIKLFSTYQKDNKYSRFDATITLKPNSRHIINVDVHTNNPGEIIHITSNSYNLENSFSQLETNVKNKLKSYDSKKYSKQKELEEKWSEDSKRNRQLALDVEKKRLEDKKNAELLRIKLEEEKRIKEQEKNNIAIMKKLAKSREEDIKEDENVIKELERAKNILEEQKIIEIENKAKLEEHIKILQSEKVEDDIEADKKIQEKIKESKEKIKELHIEENECLVIVEEIEEIENKEFDPDDYEVGQPFSLANVWFYHDGKGNNFKALDDGSGWEPFNDDIKPYFDENKQPKIQELEYRLSEARKRRKHHLKDIVDGKALIEQLRQSKNLIKQKEKEAKEAAKKLKEDQKASAIESEENAKSRIKAIDIDIAETHAANEPWLNKDNVYVCHNGEGIYYYSDSNGEWQTTTKDAVYGKSELVKTSLETEHKAGDQFQNGNGDWFYYDGVSYLKSENGAWVPSNYVEAHIKKTETKKKLFSLTKKLENEEETKIQNDDIKVDDSNNKNNDEASNNITYDENGGQQWSDENGTWWYLDSSGNYYYSDGTNWIPYQAS